MAGQFGGTYRRAMVTLVPPVVAAAAVIGVFATLAHRLPERLAGTGGFGDSASTSRVLAITLVWSLLALIWGLVWLHARRRVPTAQRWIGVSTWVASVLIVGYVLQLVLRNVDLAGPPARPDLDWTSPLVVVPVLAIVALLAWWAMGPDPEEPDAATGPRPGAPRLQLSGGERALFTRTVFSRRGLASALFWAVLAAWQAVFGAGSYIVVVVFVLAAIIAAAQSWARVLVDEHGVQVIQPLLRRVLVRAELRTVVEARAGTLDPRALPRATYGAFHTPRQSGYRATAGGEVLRLQLSNGREFIVTVPGAATAAGLVNTQLDRRRATAGDDRC
jgi:hypothetical protein